MREAGRLLAQAVQQTIQSVRPGMTTADVDAVFAAAIAEQPNVQPLFLHYQGFPKTICTSVNDEVVHGIPGDRVLNDGDILSVDCGLRYNGYCADMARTIPVGTISEATQKLLDITRESRDLGIAEARPGNTIGDIGAAVQAHAEQSGFTVVRSLVGHGIGTELHEEPAVPNYGAPGSGMRLEAGMVLAIEPMVNAGVYDVTMDEDEWTIRTADGALSAHFEDTVLITEEGPEVLTRLS